MRSPGRCPLPLVEAALLLYGWAVAEPVGSRLRELRRLPAAVAIGVALALLSTFVGVREAAATYPEILGCETGCRVAASGWPLVFVRDYTGMSVVGTADVLEVWLAADRFDPLPFLADTAFWTVFAYAAWSRLARQAGAR